MNRSTNHAMNRVIRRSRRGTTLIEVAIGTMLMALLIVPTLAAMNQSEALRRRHHSHRMMLFSAEERLEQEQVALSDAKYFSDVWNAGFGTDTLSKVALDDGGILIGRTRVLADTSVGKSPAQLVSITVDVWNDVNGDRRMDATEPHETIQSQWASP